jgi:SAM-dependent methyltransferase
MDWQLISKFIKKWWISRVDYTLELIKKYNLEWKINFLDAWCWDWEVCKLVETQFENIYWIELLQERINRFYTNNPNSKAILKLWDLNKKLEFNDNTFDCITSLVVLDWVYDLNNILFEIQRILNKDGIFILEVNNLWFLPRRLKLLFWNYPKISAFSRSEWEKIWWDSNVCHLFVKKELSSFLQEFWFEIIEVSWSGLFYKFRKWWPSLLCWDLFYVLKKK